MAYANIEDKRAYHREYMRETRKWRMERGCCAECGAQDAFTLVGKYRCAECDEKHNGYKRDRAADNEKLKRRREYRRENRLCTQCGKALSAKYQYLMCDSCRARDREKQEARRREKGILSRFLYRELGLCMKCGAPRMDGLKAWGGDEIQLCERCYDNVLKAGKAGRDRALEKHGSTWGNYQDEYERLIRHGKKRENQQVR